MTNERISIVMPLRDAAATLGHAMESIFAQTWPDWELLAVDDGSRDGTSELLRRFVDPRVRVISTPPQGIARALQTGCKAARGIC